MILTSEFKFGEIFSLELNMLVQITFETRTKNTGFYIRGREFQTDAPAKYVLDVKQVRPWFWHVEVIYS